VPVLTAALIAVPIARARGAREQIDLRDFKATRLMLDLSLAHAEPHTLVLTSYYKLFFVLWSARFIDGSRPDVVVVNPNLFGYPGYLESTLAHHPSLKQLAWSIVVHGKLTEPATAGLALQGPVQLEPDPYLADDVMRYLLPNGPLYNASPEPLSSSGVPAVSKAHMSRWRKFYHLIGTAWNEHETRRMLVWCHYQDALFFARMGDRKSARQSVQMAVSLGSQAPQLAGLAKALEEPGNKGPIDINPYLVEGPD